MIGHLNLRIKSVHGVLALMVISLIVGACSGLPNEAQPPDAPIAAPARSLGQEISLVLTLINIDTVELGGNLELTAVVDSYFEVEGVIVTVELSDGLEFSVFLCPEDNLPIFSVI